jgi:hypothetical protein
MRRLEKTMKTLTKIALLAAPALLLFISDILFHPAQLLPGIQLVSEAEAQYRRAARTRRRGVAVGYAAGSASAHNAADNNDAAVSSQQAATAQQQAEVAEQQAGVAQQQAAVAQQQAAASTAAAGKLPLGSVAPTLPSGCTPVTAGGVQYHQCGSNYYRAVFQGNSLVYVTADPSQG